MPNEWPISCAAVEQMSSMHAGPHVVALGLQTFAKSNTSAFGMYDWPQPFEDTPPTFVGKPRSPGDPPIMISKWLAVPGSTSVSFTLNDENVSRTHDMTDAHAASPYGNPVSTCEPWTMSDESMRSSFAPCLTAQPLAQRLRKIVLLAAVAGATSVCGRPSSSSIRGRSAAAILV